MKLKPAVGTSSADGGATPRKATNLVLYSMIVLALIYPNQNTGKPSKQS